MIDESCEVPREDLDEGFNPCRRQAVENGELRQYAHMYDVMNERYDREEDTSCLDSVKRDRISQSTPSQSTGGGKVYSQDTNGVEGFISTSGTLEPAADDEIPSSKAVADYVTANIPDIPALEAEIEGKLDKYEDASGHDRLYAVGPTGTQYMCILAKTIPESGYEGNPFTVGAIKDYAPIPLPVSKGGTGAQTAQGALANLLPHTTSEEPATGALVYDVDGGSTYLRAISGEPNGNQTDLVGRAGIQAMIDAAVANLAAKSDLENYVQKSTETSAHGQVYAVTKDGEQAMEDIVVHLVES